MHDRRRIQEGSTARRRGGGTSIAWSLVQGRSQAVPETLRLCRRCVGGAFLGAPSTVTKFLLGPSACQVTSRRCACLRALCLWPVFGMQENPHRNLGPSRCSPSRTVLEEIELEARPTRSGRSAAGRRPGVGEPRDCPDLRRRRRGRSIDDGTMSWRRQAGSAASTCPSGCRDSSVRQANEPLPVPGSATHTQDCVSVECCDATPTWASGPVRAESFAAMAQR
jgi:hypothetical protein